MKIFRKLWRLFNPRYARIEFNIDDEAYEYLSKKAKREGKLFDEVVEQILREYLDEK
jgi:hypothetical protein